jgi:hypothetical protein
MESLNCINILLRTLDRIQKGNPFNNTSVRRTNSNATEKEEILFFLHDNETHHFVTIRFVWILLGSLHVSPVQPRVMLVSVNYRTIRQREGSLWRESLED